MHGPGRKARGIAGRLRRADPRPRSRRSVAPSRPMRPRSERPFWPKPPPRCSMRWCSMPGAPGRSPTAESWRPTSPSPESAAGPSRTASSTCTAARSGRSCATTGVRAVAAIGIGGFASELPDERLPELAGHVLARGQEDHRRPRWGARRARAAAPRDHRDRGGGAAGAAGSPDGHARGQARLEAEQSERVAVSDRLASLLVGELLALSDDDLRPLAERLAPFLDGRAALRRLPQRRPGGDPPRRPPQHGLPDDRRRPAARRPCRAPLAHPRGRAGARRVGPGDGRAEACAHAAALLAALR